MLKNEYALKPSVLVCLKQKSYLHLRALDQKNPRVKIFLEDERELQIFLFIASQSKMNNLFGATDF